jgi:hypothetical protein
MPDLSKSLSALLNGAKKSQNKGMDDTVPAMIDGGQPAALSPGEFVIPADVVAMLGDGNTEAGAEVLQHMIDEVRKMKTGSKKQAKPITEGLSKLLNLEE